MKFLILIQLSKILLVTPRHSNNLNGMRSVISSQFFKTFKFILIFFIFSEIPRRNLNLIEILCKKVVLRNLFLGIIILFLHPRELSLSQSNRNIMFLRLIMN